MNKLRTILLAITGIMMSLSSYAQKSQQFDKSKIKLSWNVDKIKLYHSEPAIITLYLWTPAITAQGVSESKSASLDHGKFSMLSHADFDHTMEVVDKGGEKWYVYPIESYAVAISKAGKYNLKGGRYFVDLGIPTIYDDPFWGRMQTMQTERVEVPVRPLEITVSSLPDNGNTDFSGSVGEFHIDVSIPPGDIYLNEDALAIITVRGPGWIPDHTLPEYREGFGNGTKLKSFSENRRQYVKDGELYSELQLECTFIPTDKENPEIGPVKIEYFNPKTKSYETAVSDKAKVQVQSIAGKSPMLDI